MDTSKITMCCSSHSVLEEAIVYIFKCYGDTEIQCAGGTLIYLKGYIWIQFELLDLLDPRLKLLCLRVDEIVEDGALRWELYCLEFCYPPFGEFHSVIHQL